MSLELEKPAEPRTCRLCGDPVDDVCPRCGVDKHTGDLVNEPRLPESAQKDGRRKLRREAARELANRVLSTTTRQWIGRMLRTSLQGWAATLLCMVFVGAALSFQRVPWANVPLPWPGQLMAAFILCYVTIEHARGAREGHKDSALLDGKGAFDPSLLGMSLMMALLLLPLYAGPFMGSIWITVFAALPVVLLFPAFLGALVTDSMEELSLSRLKQAVVESPRYLRTTVVAMGCLVGGLLALWLPSEESPLWRAPLAVLGATFAGVFCGLMRKDAETMIDEDAE